MMRSHVRAAVTVGVLGGFISSLGIAWAALPPAAGGIKGRVRLTGKAPGNPVIRMGVDPLCAKSNAGKRVFQETVVTDREGGLAHVFVKLMGRFPSTPVPAAPVTIDQRGCVYVPRVIGARVGQTLQVRNSDALLHNVHSASAGGNVFNVGQPVAGLVFRHPLKPEPEMVSLKCDVHRWMTTYVGVVDHPYFAVTGKDGAFEIANVPAGTYSIRAWHERYGLSTASVRVTSGTAATVAFVYTGLEKTPGPSTGR